MNQSNGASSGRVDPRRREPALTTRIARALGNLLIWAAVMGLLLAWAARPH